MNDLTHDQIKAILKREYPHLLTAELERMARTCHGAKWFKELLKRAPRSVGLTQGLNDTDVEKLGEGEEETEELESATDNLGKSGEAEETEECAPHPMESVDLEQTKSELAEKRAAQIREMEVMTQLLLSSNISRVQHMRASIALALFKGSLDPDEVADHFGVSDETVRVQTKKVEEIVKNRGA